MMAKVIRGTRIFAIAFRCHLDDSWRPKSCPTARPDRSRRTASADKWPKAIRKGSAVVKIYRRHRDVGDLFTAVHSMGGSPTRQAFSDEASANETASRIARGPREALNSGDAVWRKFTLTPLGTCVERSRPDSFLIPASSCRSRPKKPPPLFSTST
jgi:hypothetical protein